jgi:hypothetical protein
LYSQYQAKKAAKKAEKENRRMAAWNALMQAAAGGIPQNDFRASPEPQIDYGGALATLGSGVSAAGGALAEHDYKQQLITMKQAQATAAAQQQGIENGLNMRRVVADEGRAAEAVRSNKASENQAWQNNMRQESQNMSAFERNVQNDTNDAEFKRKQLDLEGRKIDLLSGREKVKPGTLSEAELVRIATAKKEEDPIAALVAGQMGKPVPSGFKNPDSARKKAIQRLMTDYNWSEQDAGDLLGNSNDPMGLR